MAGPVTGNTQRLVPKPKPLGVRVLSGGDYGFPFDPNGRNARDLRHFVDPYGYTFSDALVAATRADGESMQTGDRRGRLPRRSAAGR